MSADASIERDGGRLVLTRYLEPLAPYLADNTLTEIVINRPGEVFVEGLKILPISGSVRVVNVMGN